MVTDGFSSTANFDATSLFACDVGTGTKLYAGTANNNNGCELHSYTGALNPPHAWDPAIATGGFGDGSNQTLACMAQYNDSGTNKLFMGTQKGWGAARSGRGTAVPPRRWEATASATRSTRARWPLP